jgi:hypothetical protein
MATLPKVVGRPVEDNTGLLPGSHSNLWTVKAASRSNADKNLVHTVRVDARFQTYTGKISQVYNRPLKYETTCTCMGSNGICGHALAANDAVDDEIARLWSAMQIRQGMQYHRPSFDVEVA